jgi:predicted ester cyclase
MTKESILAFFADQQKHWQRRDPDGLARGHAEQGTVVSLMFGRRQGRPDIADSYRALFKIFPDWTYTAEPVLVDGTRVAEPFSAAATHVGEFMGLAGTNRPFRIQGVRLFDMGDGLIQHERRMYDFTAFLIQIGILKGKPAY